MMAEEDKRTHCNKSPTQTPLINVCDGPWDVQGCLHLHPCSGTIQSSGYGVPLEKVLIVVGVGPERPGMYGDLRS